MGSRELLSSELAVRTQIGNLDIVFQQQVYRGGRHGDLAHHDHIVNFYERDTFWRAGAGAFLSFPRLSGICTSRLSSPSRRTSA